VPVDPKRVCVTPTASFDKGISVTSTWRRHLPAAHAASISVSWGAGRPWCCLIALLSRDRLDINVLQDRNPQYVVLSDGSIRNGYTVKLLNMVPEPRSFELSIEGLPGAVMSVVGIDQQETRSITIEAEPDKLKTVRVYVRQPRDQLSQGQGFSFVVADRAGAERDVYAAKFNVPETLR
jgi:hypothetical protein